jgi:oligoendopeptidase F
MFKLTLTTALILVLVSVAAVAAAGERAQVPEKYRWNLTDLYASPAAFDAARAETAARIPSLARHAGHLGDSAAALLGALDEHMAVHAAVARLGTYANLLHTEDTRIAQNLERSQAAEQIAVDLSAATAYLRPEILALGRERIDSFLRAEPRLGPYRTFLDDILRWKPHTLATSEEVIVAQAGNLADAGAAAHSIFTNADLPYPEIALSTGEKVRLDAAAYGKYRALPNREDRRRVFEAFWDEYGRFRRTLGTTLYQQVKAHVFEKTVHHFDSCLEAALFRDNVPPTVYRQLIADVRANLPTLHRYLKLRQRMLGVPVLEYHDIYAPLVNDVDLTFTPDKAMALTLEAFEPLGPDYVAALRKGYDSRWVDWLPSTGKRAGAFSSGAYGVHPYQLLNFNGRYEDLSTLAHESGHSIHTYLADARQPYVTHDYSIFVAEVASTLNENLLADRMLKRAKSDDERLSLLGSRLDALRGTLFRQTLFAEFELAIHDKVERGETLSGDSLSALYLQLVREYMGHDAGVCRVDERYGVEWAMVPHFYYDFYVYQYATSLVASLSLARDIREEAALRPATLARRDAYLRMLSAGSSKYPVDLLREAGVDLTTPAPFTAAMKEMNGVMDEMEALLARSAARR